LKEVNRFIKFATKNKGKFDEAVRVTMKYGIELSQVSLEKYEIQADDLKEIATISAQEALREVGATAILTEDAGFFIDALNGFPGPYSSFVYRTLGVEGILKLLDGVDKRAAHFACVVAYCDGSHTTCFEGVVQGNVNFEPRGQQGFGFDPIFVPDQGDGRTFAELEVDEKNRYSHRALAFSNFCRWVTSTSISEK